MKNKKHPYAEHHQRVENEELSPNNEELSSLVTEDPWEGVEHDLSSFKAEKGETCEPFSGKALGGEAPIMPEVPEPPLDPASIKNVCREVSCPICTETKAELAVLKDERMRMMAEMENFKKRLTREKEEQVKFAAEKVLSDLLPTLDTFELALTHGRGNEACKEMLTGLEMAHKIFLEALAAHGMEKIGAEGEPFDPEIHEAMMQTKRDDMLPGHVAQLFQPGYTLKERLLRPAKVIVSQ